MSQQSVSLEIILASKISRVVMRVREDESFNDIISRYCREDHGPPYGVNLTYGGKAVVTEDTPKSLGISSEMNMIMVKW